jgi:hypothetical protein
MSQSPETVILTLGPAQKVALDLGQGVVNARKVSDNKIQLKFRTKDFEGARARPAQRDGRARPAFAGRAEGSERNLVILDAGDVLHDAFAVGRPGVNTESEARPLAQGQNGGPQLVNFSLFRPSIISR